MNKVTHYTDKMKLNLDKKLDEFMILFSQLSSEGQLEYIYSTPFLKTIHSMGWEDYGKFKLSDETKQIIEKDTNMTLEEIKKKCLVFSEEQAKVLKIASDNVKILNKI